MANRFTNGRPKTVPIYSLYKTELKRADNDGRQWASMTAGVLRVEVYTDFDLNSVPRFSNPAVPLVVVLQLSQHAVFHVMMNLSNHSQSFLIRYAVVTYFDPQQGSEVLRLASLYVCLHRSYLENHMSKLHEIFGTC